MGCTNNALAFLLPFLLKKNVLKVLFRIRKQEAYQAENVLCQD